MIIILISSVFDRFEVFIVQLTLTEETCEIHSDLIQFFSSVQVYVYVYMCCI